MGATSAERACLTMDFVGKMTTYELRQEAEKRGLLEKMPVVNHAALLQRLVQVIVEQEYERGRQTTPRTTYPSCSSCSEPDGAVSEKERLRKNRSDLKAAAIERSKQRQANQDYFLAKKQMNVRNHAPTQQPADEASPLADEDKDVGSLVNPCRHKVFVR